MSGYSGSLLLSSKLSDFEPIGYEGEPVWKSASQINHILKARLSADHAALFATPVVEETDNRIDWFAASKGQYQRWDTLDVDAQMRIARLVETYAADTEALSKKLIESGAGDAVMLGDRLRGACYAASAADVFVVDDKPVVANWSLRLRNHPNAPSVLPTLSSLVAEPVIPEEPVDALADEPKYSRLIWALKFLLPLLLLLVVLVFWFWWDDSLTGGKAQSGAMPETKESRTENQTENMGKALNLPTEALEFGDLSFLDGRWRSVTTLISTSTLEPVVAEYIFNKEGRGTKSILEKDQSCEARVDAEIIDRRLHLRDESEAKCTDGQAYRQSETICEPAEDQTAVCVLLQKGIKEDTFVVITRMKN